MTTPPNAPACAPDGMPWLPAGEVPTTPWAFTCALDGTVAVLPLHRAAPLILFGIRLAPLHDVAVLLARIAELDARALAAEQHAADIHEEAVRTMAASSLLAERDALEVRARAAEASAAKGRVAAVTRPDIASGAMLDPTRLIPLRDILPRLIAGEDPEEARADLGIPAEMWAPIAELGASLREAWAEERRKREEAEVTAASLRRALSTRHALHAEDVAGLQWTLDRVEAACAAATARAAAATERAERAEAQIQAVADLTRRGPDAAPGGLHVTGCNAEVGDGCVWCAGDPEDVMDARWRRSLRRALGGRP